jgi:renalase
MSPVHRHRVAVIGAGMAGATCARRLADAGFAVQVFDKSRGAGGRMATRRTEWLDGDGQSRPARFDHGTWGFGAQGHEFADLMARLSQQGVVARWLPRLAPGSYAPLDEAACWVAQPDMPALCRALLDGVPVHTACLIESLHRRAEGWVLSGAGITAEAVFDTVMLAIPGPQAAPLLAPHQPAWAERAAAMPLRPVWTLMAVTDEPRSAEPFDLAWPPNGELASIVRNDRKPGRPQLAGLAHWVVHATTAFSEAHLEADAASVLPALQAALTRWLGQPLVWHHAVVHRWRYATVQRAPSAAQANTQRCGWDAELGLGVCGDAWGGGGVEGAWVSGRALAMHIIERPREVTTAQGGPVAA